MPRSPDRPVRKVGRRKRVRSPAGALVWLAGSALGLALLLLLARQSWPLAALVLAGLAAFAWWEWKRE